MTDNSAVKRREVALFSAIAIGLTVGLLVKKVRLGILLGLVIGLVIVFLGWLKTKRVNNER